MGQIIRKRKNWDVEGQRVEYRYMVVDSMGDMVEITGVCVCRDEEWTLAIWMGREEMVEKICRRLIEAKSYLEGYCVLEAWLDWDK